MIGALLFEVFSGLDDLSPFYFCNQPTKLLQLQDTVHRCWKERGERERECVCVRERESRVESFEIKFEENFEQAAKWTRGKCFGPLQKG